MYWREFGRNWVALLAAGFGLAFGSALSHYTTSLFGPSLIGEFGWSRADFALIGSVPIVSFFLIPLAGRFTDRFGTRAAAILGFTALPLGYLGFAFMSGSLVEFFAIYVAQHIFGMLTTSMVFCRVVVERFDSARGLALSLVLTAPAMVGAAAPLLLADVIQGQGWRTAYLAMAAMTAAGGLVAILMMQRSRKPVVAASERPDRRLSWAEFGALMRHPTLLLIMGGMLLVNVPQIISSSQLMLVVQDSGASSEAAVWMVSLYAIGVIIGRFLSGLALDHVEPHRVAIAALGLPAVGYMILASSATSVELIALSIVLIGLAQGAESDIGAVLISRRFDMKNFSMLLSFVTAMIAIGSIAGSFILSASLRANDSYDLFLIVSAVATLLGAFLFAMTGRSWGGGTAREAALGKAVVAQAGAGEIA